MEGHKCIHELDIGRTLGILTNIVKEFYGNGNEGLSKTIPRLENQIGTLIEVTAGQATAISALAKAVTEITAIGEYKGKEEEKKRDKTKIWISVIFGITGIVITLIVKFL